MSPIPAISPSVANAIPDMDLMTQGATAPISGIQMPSELAAPTGVTSAQPVGNSFDSMLGQMVSEVNSKQMEAGQSVSALQSGQNIPLHRTVIAMEEANVSFQLMVEVRNRLLDSYQEIMRMQV